MLTINLYECFEFRRGVLFLVLTYCLMYSIVMQSKATKLTDETISSNHYQAVCMGDSGVCRMTHHSLS